VPKLILQPVVENAIYHGIEKRKGEGLLSISAEIQNEELLLIVEDNGVGISEEKLLGLRKSIENDSFDNSDNFALKNLNRQLKLKYGNSYGISVKSVEGSGTSVIIKLQADRKRGA
jgi:two-component system sensor histidine kinase YesM